MGRKAIELDVEAIKDDAVENKMTLQDLAKKYKVSHQTIYNRLKKLGIHYQGTYIKK